MARKRTGMDQEIDRLFALEPSVFTAARDEVARRLKEDGQAEAAAEVRALRRPTVAAWAANQVSRQHPDQVRELLLAGDELRQIQRKVLSGVRTGGLREAMDRRRRAVATLVVAAERLLGESGKGSATTIEAIQPTFEAASVDDEAGRLLSAGRLTRELAAPAGFGGVTGLEVVAAPRERASSARTKGGEDAATREARRESRDLERQAAEARRRAIRSQAAMERAEEKANRLAGEADEARKLAKDAAREHRDAEAQARRLEAAAARASDRAERLGRA